MAFGKEIDRWEQSEISCSSVSRFYFNVYSHHDAFRRATYYSKFDLLKLFPSSWKQGSYDGNTTFLIHHIFEGIFWIKTSVYVCWGFWENSPLSHRRFLSWVGSAKKVPFSALSIQSNRNTHFCLKFSHCFRRIICLVSFVRIFVSNGFTPDFSLR